MKYNVCVQGLGFVGSAMAVAVAKNYQNKYNVTGVDLPNKAGIERVKKINNGLFPFETTDEFLKDSLCDAVKNKTLKATHDVSVYEKADVVLISIPFELSSLVDDTPESNWQPLISGAEQLASRIPSSCLIILQTTVLPGTTTKKILPIFEDCFRKRGINSLPLIAYSYERVMPGKEYLNSIINNHRCYAALNFEAEERCDTFFKDFINTSDFPLFKMSNIEAAETAKIMENSYRATNIAFIEEWSQFSETIGVDLNEVIRAIRLRDTHKNIAQPGFGVGGYCLTKDPLFAEQSAREFYELNESYFPFCRLAVKTNQQMPLRCLKRLEENLGELNEKKILLAGVSYKSDVGDTRYSPAGPFFNKATEMGAMVTLTDPLADCLDDVFVENDIKKIDLNLFDAIVFAVNHPQYKEQQVIDKILDINNNVMIFDACHLIDSAKITKKMLQKNVYVIGRGKLS
ncbi:MAG TPA: nucleotide sugar dehydrogenase [Gammaproteobacteria bacterium]|nr:nucleotide sugar dehydrogenase [Gammaproteobacteria bacterium]